MRSRCTFGATAVLLLGVSALAHAAGNHSGFLEDYSGLQPGVDRPGAMVFRTERASPAKCDKIAIAPIEIRLAPASLYKEIVATTACEDNAHLR